MSSFINLKFNFMSIKILVVLIIAIVAVFVPTFIWDIISHSLFYQELIAGSVPCDCRGLSDGTPFCTSGREIKLDGETYHEGRAGYKLVLLLTVLYAAYILFVVTHVIKRIFPDFWEEFTN
jgi:ABC-type multidrug transport system fused ATPase/permease subunit